MIDQDSFDIMIGRDDSKDHESIRLAMGLFYFMTLEDGEFSDLNNYLFLHPQQIIAHKLKVIDESTLMQIADRISAG